MATFKLTPDTGEVSGTHSDMPLVVIPSELEMGALSTAEADSIRFYSDASLTTELPREVVSADQIHVKVSSVSSSTEIWADYDGIRSDYAVTATYGAQNVWKTEYKQVLNFEGNSNDSTSNSNDGTDTSITYSTANGKIGQGAGFNGSTSNIAYPSLGLGNSFTFSFWFNTNSPATEQRFAYNDDTDNIFVIVRILDSKVALQFYDGTTNFTVSGTTTLSANTDYKVTAVFNSSGTCRIKLNGIEEGTVAVGTKTDLGTEFGRYHGTNRVASGHFFDGEIDLLRILNEEPTADWETTEYNNQNDNAAFWVATEEVTEVEPPTSFVEALVVAGGGGGGGTVNGRGGGGGAGGLVYSDSYSITPGAKTITIGAGGAQDTNGGNTVFGDITAIGGGAGGGYSIAGSDGGSGGGGGPAGGTGGLATQGNSDGATGYGNKAGDSWEDHPNGRSTGGGGGAGAIGRGISTGEIPTGGAGLAYSISGTSTYYAGGGGGGSTLEDQPIYKEGAGGNGGGGDGASVAVLNGVDGTANTGGGGGGASFDGSPGNGGAGGSGIVIISYATDGSDGVSTDSTGGTVTTSGGQTIHTFTADGTFTVVEAETPTASPIAHILQMI